MLKAITMGLLDGWQQGPELSVGMSFDDLRRQQVYDAMTYLGCGFAVLLSRGWQRPEVRS
jgi:hypothetical protein